MDQKDVDDRAAVLHGRIAERIDKWMAKMIDREGDQVAFALNMELATSMIAAGMTMADLTDDDVVLILCQVASRIGTKYRHHMQEVMH